MTRGMKRSLIVIGVVFALLIATGFVLRMAQQPSRSTVLEMKIEGELSDQPPSGALARLLGEERLSVRDHLEALMRARGDRRINGVFLEIDGLKAGSAKIQELRDALVEFQKSGKWATAFLETAGEFSAGNRDYYLASACGEVWLAPPGDLNLIGVRAEVQFIRGTLDKLGIVPQFDHIGKYKNAMNSITDKAMNQSFRESMETLVGGIYRQMLRGIATSRGKTELEIAALVDGGPYLSQQALEKGLVDHLGYRDQVLESLETRNGGSLPLLKVSKYLKSGRYYDHGVGMALIHGTGTVTRGDSDQDPFGGATTMGSTTVARAIKAARQDDGIKAIILRIDSPGGSYIASDLIWREVSLTRGVKPIVVSMADVAASGGYFVAMNADHIVAEPGTITASIGVLAGKLITTGFWEKLGITFDAVQRGRHATFYSTSVPYTPEEKAIFTAWLRRIYEDFVGKAAKGRGKTFEEIDAIAQGRVWTGEDALRLGLVDELGGLETAVRAALQILKREPTERVRLVVMPAERGLFGRLFEDETRAPFAALVKRAERLIEYGPGPGPDRVLELPFVPDLR